MNILNRIFKKDNYMNCKCRPVTEEARVNQLNKLKEYGFCLVCKENIVD